MRWLVEPLVAAGFRVIAVDHHGNNYVDGYEPEGFLFVWERPRDLTFVLDVLANEQPHGPVGAAGFSVGGYTVAGPSRRASRSARRRRSLDRAGAAATNSRRGLICRTPESGPPSKSPPVSARC
jgi:predicted dienelactone hydrolase